MSEQWIYLDGEYVTKENAKVSVFDHGFLYGDGIFEGIRIYNGNIFKCKEHLDRLYDSAKSIDLVIPWHMKNCWKLWPKPFDAMTCGMGISVSWYPAVPAIWGWIRAAALNRPC